LERFQVLRLMGASDVLVNPTTHDGTPNSLLEAMSMGLFPVCGEVQSIREWIANGENGLITTTSPHTLGKGMLHAIQDAGLRRKAAQTNARLVAAYAEKEEVARIAQEFYKAVLSA
jgi:glycosyltransferase involved in cell wall biosynthesis